MGWSAERWREISEQFDALLALDAEARARRLAALADDTSLHEVILSGGDPLTIERMRACDGPVLVALSGGGDSVGLLHLLVDEFGAAHVRAGVVDHALRDGSADDARRALGFAVALGVQGEVLTLRWPHGPKAAQQAAREARYAALCAYARKLGARVIATRIRT